MAPDEQVLAAMSLVCLTCEAKGVFACDIPLGIHVTSPEGPIWESAVEHERLDEFFAAHAPCVRARDPFSGRGYGLSYR